MVVSAPSITGHIMGLGYARGQLAHSLRRLLRLLQWNLTLTWCQNTLPSDSLSSTGAGEQRMPTLAKDSNPAYQDRASLMLPPDTVRLDTVLAAINERQDLLDILLTDRDRRFHRYTGRPTKWSELDILRCVLAVSVCGVRLPHPGLPPVSTVRRRLKNWRPGTLADCITIVGVERYFDLGFARQLGILDLQTGIFCDSAVLADFLTDFHRV